MTLYFTRNEWGSNHGTGGYEIGRVGEVIVHHSWKPHVPPTATHAYERAVMRSIERFHVIENGWDAIGYQFLVFQSGRGYEGRGWGRSGAHTKGRNSKSVGICFVINGDEFEPTEKAWDKARELIAEGIEVGALDPDYVLSGHADYSGKSCPGELVYPIIGEHLSPMLVTATDQQPTVEAAPPEDDQEGDMARTHDLMREFQGLQRGSVFLSPDEQSGDWEQHFGQTKVTNQRKNSPEQGIQNGRMEYAATLRDGTTAIRMVTTRAFGPDIDVFGWFRVFRWEDGAGANHGVKLYTGFEDNNANNTVSLLRKGRPTAWYVEDRVGVYPQGDNDGDHQASGSQVDPTLHVRHRFLWRQRVEDAGLRGTLYIDGEKQFTHLSSDPLYRGRVGWRLDGTGTDWSLAVVEH